MIYEIAEKVDVFGICFFQKLDAVLPSVALTMSMLCILLCLLSLHHIPCQRVFFLECQPALLRSICGYHVLVPLR